MRVTRRIQSMLQTLFKKEQLRGDLDAELRSYVALLADEKIRAGMGPEEAYRQARLELGGIEQVKAGVYERRVGAPIDRLCQDVRFALRTLRRNPGFTAVAVLTSGIGIGAATATYSAVDGVLLRPFPYADASELVFLGSVFPETAVPSMASMPDFLDWRERITGLEHVAALQTSSLVVTDDLGSERVATAFVSPRYLQVLGVTPALGRDFVEEDHLEGAEPVIMLSHTAWVSRFGGEASALGQTVLTADGEDAALRSHRVVGVLPEGVRPPARVAASEPEVWAPMAIDGEAATSGRGQRTLDLVGRLRPDVPLAILRQELDGLAARMWEEYPDDYEWDDARIGIGAIPVRNALVGDVHRALLVFLGASGLLLLIGSVNVASLLLAREPHRLLLGPRRQLRNLLDPAGWVRLETPYLRPCPRPDPGLVSRWAPDRLHVRAHRGRRRLRNGCGRRRSSSAYRGPGRRLTAGVVPRRNEDRFLQPQGREPRHLYRKRGRQR